MKTVLYARVSTLEQTIEHQLAHAEKAGFVIDEVVSDNGVSGIATMLRERPEGRRLFDMLRKSDTLVVRWIDRLEYGIFGLPRPDYTVFLNVPAAKASRLIARKPARAYLRGKRRDAHEADPGHLLTAQRIYLELAERRPRRQGALLSCVEKGRLLSIQEVGERVWMAVERRFGMTED